MRLKKNLIAGVITAALASPIVASAITVDGITFGTGFIVERAEVFEAERFGADMYADGTAVASPAGPFGPVVGNDNSVIDAPGEELVGIGRILTIRDQDSNALQWQNGDNGRELTFYIYGFVAENFGPNTVGFTGGRVDIYSDTAMDFSASTGSQATDIDTATNGNLWLSLEGSPIGLTPPGSSGVGAFTGGLETLLATFFGTSASTPGFILGAGLLDVTGGAAADHLDTNQFGCVIGPGCPDDADKTFSSDGNGATTTPADGAGDSWSFDGNVTVTDFGIPEPMTTALMGLGLVGMGMARRKRS